MSRRHATRIRRRSAPTRGRVAQYYATMTLLVIVLALLFFALGRRMVAPQASGAAPLPLPSATAASTLLPAPSPVPAPHFRPRPQLHPVSHVAAVELLDERVAAAGGVVPVVGPPTISLPVLEATLGREGLLPASLGPYIYDAGRRFGIDPAVLLAFSSYFDLGDPLPRAAHNVGHIKASGSEPAVRGYRVFDSWQSGIDAWYRLIRDLYVRQWGLRSVDAIVPVYSPGNGRHSVEAAINSLRAMLVAWRGAST